MSIHSLFKPMPRLSVHARRALAAERRQQILTAAAAVFAEKGFDRATISDVARAAGLAEGSIYNYFRDKQDLLVHLPRQFMLPPIETFQAAIAAEQHPTPESILQAAAQNLVSTITQNREIARVLFTTIPLMDEKMRAEYMRQVPLYAFETIESFVTAMQDAGVFRADLDPALAARAFPGMMLFFLLVQEILQPPNMPRFEYDEILPHIVQIYLYGVMTESQTKTSSKAPARKTRKKKTPARKRNIVVE